MLVTLPQPQAAQAGWGTTEGDPATPPSLNLTGAANRCASLASSYWRHPGFLIWDYELWSVPRDESAGHERYWGVDGAKTDARAGHTI